MLDSIPSALGFWKVRIAQWSCAPRRRRGGCERAALAALSAHANARAASAPVPRARAPSQAMGFTEQALEDVDPETRVLAKFSGDTRMIKTLPWAAAEDRRSARENARHAA